MLCGHILTQLVPLQDGASWMKATDSLVKYSSSQPGQESDFPNGHTVLSLLPVIQTPGKVQGSPTPSCNLHLPPILIPHELIICYL